MSPALPNAVLPTTGFVFVDFCATVDDAPTSEAGLVITAPVDAMLALVEFA